METEREQNTNKDSAGDNSKELAHIQKRKEVREEIIEALDPEDLPI